MLRTSLTSVGIIPVVRLTQAKSPENRRRRSIASNFLWAGGLLVALLSAVDGVALAFLIEARSQSQALSTGALPRAVAAERLAVDASHLTALTDELPGAASVAERQTIMQRIDGLRAALNADIDMLKQAGLSPADQAMIAKSEAELLAGADTLNVVAQSGIGLESELARQRDRARAACEQRVASRDCQDLLWALAGPVAVPVQSDQPELRMVAVLQRDITLNEQHRINLLRRQSEMAARFLALAGAQSEVADEEIRRQQQNITAWVTRLAWGLATTLMVTLAVVARLRRVARRPYRRRA